jgi:AcrR family transcriptional regulator
MTVAVGTPSSARRRLSAEDRREQLLDVATQVIVERGFGGVSVDSVARRAGITRAVIYQHFTDVQALLEAVVKREMSRALAQVSETALGDLSGGDPRELMLDSLRLYLTAVRNHPATWRLVLMPPAGAPELLQASIAAGRASVLAQLTQAVRPVLGPKESRDAGLTATILSAISDEYARLVLTDPVKNTPDRLVAHARWWLQRPTLD